MRKIDSIARSFPATLCQLVNIEAKDGDNDTIILGADPVEPFEGASNYTMKFLEFWYVEILRFKFCLGNDSDRRIAKLQCTDKV